MSEQKVNDNLLILVFKIRYIYIYIERERELENRSIFKGRPETSFGESQVFTAQSPLWDYRILQTSEDSEDKYCITIFILMQCKKIITFPG